MQNNSSAPIVSILLAFHNERKYIVKAIMSVLQQTFPYWELLLLDDGSTDGGKKIIQHLKPDKRIIYRRFQQNQGKGKVLNQGLQFARGKYILELDGDDWLHPDALQHFFQHMNHVSEEVALVYSDYVSVWEIQNKASYEIVKGAPFVDRIDWLQHFFVPTSRLYLKKALLDINGWDTNYPTEGRLYEDVATILKLLKKYKMSYLPATTMYVRRHTSNITSSNKYAWFPIYKYLLANALMEWKEPFIIDENSQIKTVSIKPKGQLKYGYPLISIIIYVQNNEITLPYTLQSISHQNYQKLELIIINDRSTDQSLNIIQSFVNKNKIPYKIFSLYHINGKGVAVNQALGLVKGKYVMDLSANEVLNPEAIQVFIEKMEEAEVNEKQYLCVYGNKKLFSLRPSFKYLGKEVNRQIEGLKGLFEKPLPPSPIIYRTDKLKGIGGWSYDYMSEGQYQSEWLNLARLLQTGDFLSIPRILSFNLQADYEYVLRWNYWPIKRIIIKKVCDENKINAEPLLRTINI